MAQLSGLGNSASAHWSQAFEIQRGNDAPLASLSSKHNGPDSPLLCTLCSHLCPHKNMENLICYLFMPTLCLCKWLCSVQENEESILLEYCWTIFLVLESGSVTLQSYLQDISVRASQRDSGPWLKFLTTIRVQTNNRTQEFLAQMDSFLSFAQNITQTALQFLEFGSTYFQFLFLFSLGGSLWMVNLTVTAITTGR